MSDQLNWFIQNYVHTGLPEPVKALLFFLFFSFFIFSVMSLLWKLENMNASHVN